MTVFQEIADRHINCEICGSDTIAIYGGGWDNDLIYCRANDCGAEYKFPTSTSVDDDNDN